MVLKLARALALAAAFAFLANGPASAQVPDPFARQLAQQLAQADEVQTAYNYSRAAGPFPGGLRQGESRRYPLSMRAAQNYRVVGVCDARCGDLDLRLFDPSGVLVTQDIQPDRFPIVQINPPATGVYTVEVVMSRCPADECYFAFNVFTR